MPMLSAVKSPYTNSNKQTNHREAFQTAIITAFPIRQGQSERAMHCIVRYCSACRLFTRSMRVPTIDGPIDPQSFLLAPPGQLCINGSSGGNEDSSFALFLLPALWSKAYFCSPLPLPSCPVHTSWFNVCAPTLSASACAFLHARELFLLSLKTRKHLRLKRTKSLSLPRQCCP